VFNDQVTPLPVYEASVCAIHCKLTSVQRIAKMKHVHCVLNYVFFHNIYCNTVSLAQETLRIHQIVFVMVVSSMDSNIKRYYYCKDSSL